jgi:chaperonin GroES
LASIAVFSEGGRMSFKKLKPLANRIVIQRCEAKTTKGGIFLPETAQEKPRQGTIVAVGPGKIDDKGRLHQLSVKPGDRVFFSSYAGTEYEENYLILSEDDLLAIVM